MGTGRGGCPGAKLRAEPSMKSADAGIAVCGVEVRIDLVHEIEGEKLRAHICEARGEGAENCPTGWTSSMLLSCLSKTCGVCHDCGVKDLLPSHNAHKLHSLEAQIKAEIPHLHATGNVVVRLSDLDSNATPDTDFDPYFN